ncbi:AI-2E family transporter [Natronorarus salvus]|uniref:AI-2E family transporter n=1 Tax=Natronorarus salvus TaxID=3117733 RepID=UPI002F263AF2
MSPISKRADARLRQRIVLGLLLLALLAVVAYVVEAVVAVVVVAVFLYYAVRPIYRFLRRFDLGKRKRAALALVLFGVPFLVLLFYTVAIVLLETAQLVEQYGVQDQLVRGVLEADLGGIELSELEETIAGASATAPLASLGTGLLGFLGMASSLVVQTMVLVLLTYYMLIDGPRFVAWLLETFDRDGVLTEYVRAVDPELSATLFGNIVNVFVTAAVGIVVFSLYNVVAPPIVQVPFPALLGALAGIGSLVPVIGIKLVYVPVALALLVRLVLEGDYSALLYVAGFVAVVGVLVDAIPDLLIRGLISGENTHTGLLIVAYIVGPAVFGLYGLFLAPILLVLLINAGYVLVPYVVSGELPHSRQTRLAEFDSLEPTDPGRGTDPEPGGPRSDRTTGISTPREP